jgi:hypothetical protein
MEINAHIVGRKNKANRRPAAGSSKHEALNPKERRSTEPDLKKQTQFTKRTNSCKPLI